MRRHDEPDAGRNQNPLDRGDVGFRQNLNLKSNLRADSIGVVEILGHSECDPTMAGQYQYDTQQVDPKRHSRHPRHFVGAAFSSSGKTKKINFDANPETGNRRCQ
jgi:hypothetical protein